MGTLTDDREYNFLTRRRNGIPVSKEEEFLRDEYASVGVCRYNGSLTCLGREMFEIERRERSKIRSLLHFVAMPFI